MFKRGETQIGTLMIFTVTIIVAVGTLGIISFFYSNGLSNKKYISILGNIHSSLDDLKQLGICESSTTSLIKYNLMNDSYKLTCSNEIGFNFGDIKKFDILSSCNETDMYCEYKIRK